MSAYFAEDDENNHKHALAGSLFFLSVFFFLLICIIFIIIERECVCVSVCAQSIEHLSVWRCQAAVEEDKELTNWRLAN